MDNVALGRCGARIRSWLGPIATNHAARQRVPLSALQIILSDVELEALHLCGAVIREGIRLRSDFDIHLVHGFIVFTDPDVPVGHQGRYFVDPLWEGPEFADFLVRQRADACLDMGCGCGVLALVMSSRCKRVHAVDLNPRAIEMSTLNTALNCVDNVRCDQSDLFEAVTAHPFERIVFNSPVDGWPTGQPPLLSTGEELLARFFATVPAYLAFEGVCQVNLEIRDYIASPFADRLASWLGPAVGEFGGLVRIRELNVLDDTTVVWRGWLTLRRDGDSFLDFNLTSPDIQGLPMVRRLFRKRQMS